MKVLITGGLGFIGSELAIQLKKLDAEITIIDNMSYGKCKHLLFGKYILFNGCITDKALVKTAMKGIDYVFHLGALISVADSFRIPDEYERINVQGTIILLQEAVKAGVKSFIFSSSSANYGNNGNPEKVEDMILKPVSPYALSKVHAEDYCKLVNETSNMKVVCLRYFNVFGANQDANRPYSACIANFFKNIINNDNIIIYGSGNQTRSFVHVEDVANANIYMALNKFEGIYNVGYPNEVSINEVAHKIMSIMDKKVRIQYCNARDGDVSRMYCNVDKLMSTGFKFKYTLSTGLIDMIKTHASHAQVKKTHILCLTMSSNFDMVKEFHRLFKLSLNTNPYHDCFKNEKLMKLRLGLIDEEHRELHEAVDKNDFVETVDALADIMYVTLGFFASIGVDANEAIRLVHESNMTKLCNNEEEAKETVEWYKINRPEFDAIYEMDDNKKWRVFDKKSGKVLKNKYYKAVDLKSVCGL